MNKEKFAKTLKNVGKALPILAPAVAGIAVILSRSSEDSNNSTQLKILPSSSLAKEAFLPDGAPSKQVLKEQVVIPITLPGVFALMEAAGEEKILKSAEKLREFYEREVLYITETLRPEEKDFSAASGRFPNTLVEWGDDPGLRIALPKDWLVNPQFGEADLAILLAVNLKFVEKLVANFEQATTPPTGEQIETILDEATLEIVTGFLPILGSQVKSQVLRLTYSQLILCSQSEDCNIEILPLR